MNIAIVTVVLNDKPNLLRTFKSIRKHKKSYHKYYVVDGGSKDGSLSLIKDNIEIVDGYISETDSGIYDAMNKALMFPLGDEDFIIWINAGDELCNWEEINVNEIGKYDCAFFAVVAKMNETSSGNVIAPHIYLPYNEKNFYPKSRYMHQGFLIKKKIFERIKYDVSIGLAADNLLMSNCIMKSHFFISDIPLSNFYLDGVSNTKFKSMHDSYLKVAHKLCFNIWLLLLYQRNSFIKYYIKRAIPFGWVQAIRGLTYRGE